MDNSQIKKLVTIRITFLGNSTVGKTAIINRMINNIFTPLYEPTLNMENYGIKLNISDSNIDNKTYVLLNLEDT